MAHDSREPIHIFGKPARALWSLPAPGVFLNHGSFGACPIAVQDAQERLRREYSQQPEEFFRQRVMPDNPHSALRGVAAELAEFVGASERDIALVENATTGIQCVLQSIAFATGDRIMITDHQYRAVGLAVEQRCRETGANPLVVSIPIPASAADIVARISGAANPKIKLAIVDHITSSTALVFPVHDIVAELHQHGIPVLIDGAHVIGQIPLDLRTLQAEWYVGNAHKWLFAPPGCAFLYARPDCAPLTRSLIASHFVDLGFPRAFDYVGTRDYGNWLAIPAALAFFRRLDREAWRLHNAGILERARSELMALGAEPVCAPELCGSMRSFALPQRRPAETADSSTLRDALWDEARIQIASSVFRDRLLIRISAQAYVDENDIVQLGAVLGKAGWPGR